MANQFLSVPPTPRILYLCFALVLVLSGLAIIPLQPASGASESVETSALTRAEPRNASSHGARERRYDDRDFRQWLPSTMRLFSGDTKLALLALFSEDDRSSVPHSATALRTTTAPNLISNSAATYIPPTISLTSPTNNATFIAGSTITLSATASDSDGTVSKVEFFQGAVKLGEDTTTPYGYDWTNVAAGDYVLTARATDNAGEITNSAAINISVLAQVKQYVGWSSISNGIDSGSGSVRKTSTGDWDFYANSLQTILPGDGYFESTAANYNQSINLGGSDGAGRAVVIGSGGWVGIYENNQLVAATSSNPPVPIISAHAAGDRYRIEITNSILRYIRYRSSSREVMFTSAGALPAYPIFVSLGISPQNAEWQKTALAQLTRKVTWSSITNGINLGNGSVQKTSTGVWDFSANAAQTLLRGDGYFESTASMYNQSLNMGGADGAGRAVVIGSGGWAAIYENGQEVADTSPIGNMTAHAAGDRYRIEITNGTLRYVRYRSGIRTVVYTSTNPLPSYPYNFSLGASPQNAEWQNTVIAQLSQTVSWSYITNGIDLGNGSVRKTSTGAWDFSAGPKQQLVYGSGFFESTASYFNHSINLSGSDGTARSLVVGTGGWAAIYENGQEVANTYPLQNIAAHAAGDRYGLEVIRGKLRYVRYRSGVRSIMFTSANVVPPYALGFSLGASFQNSEWQSTIFSDNVPEYNDASFVSQTVATTMVPGQTYSVTVTMRNTGASTWTPDGDYQLASENLPDNQRWGLNRVNLTTTVLPGSDATFNFTVTAPATGSHSFQWRMVQQDVERFGALTTNVSVQTVNGSPTISLTGPANNATFTAGTTVALTASASDSDGTISKVEFFQGAVKLGEDTTPPAPYTYNWTSVPAGSYVLTARATDNGGATATSSAVNITVNAPNQPPTVSLTSPANNATFTAVATIQLSANAADSDGLVNKVEFFQGAVKLGEDTTAPYSFSWGNVQAGIYSLTARATDNVGATTTSSGVNITVNQSPTVTLTSPANNATFIAGATIPLSATASDSDGTVSKVEFFQGAVKLGEVTTAPFSFNWTSVPAGSYALTARATDNGGAMTTSSVINITVNQPPTVTLTSPANNATFIAGASIPLSATASDTDGTISKVEFFQGAVKLGEVTAAPFSFNWTSVPAGSYALTARATDNVGDMTTSGIINILVNQPPVANAGGSYNGFTGTALLFNGSGSSDSDGTIVSYQWDFGDGAGGTGVTPTHTYALAGTHTVTLTVTDNNGATASTTASVVITGTTSSRLDPLNQTGGEGENSLSRNFNWSVPLVGLPGRAGLNLGLSLSYNSLVWTKSGNYISFDDDRGFPGPGFRLGFPVIQPTYFNSEVGKNAFMLIMPDGSRVELRQVGTSVLYEAADSSHLLLDTTSSTLVLRTTDGTQLSYEWKGSDYQCTKIKDRNGNFITVNYTSFGRIDTVVDTLNRTIKFNYNPADNSLESITQTWTGQIDPHRWASFTYTDKTIQTNFSSLTVVGPQNNTTIHVLSSVKLADDSRFDFSYTSWGQVWKISNFTADTDTHLLNYRAYNLPGSDLLATSPQDNCPRFTERHDWVENWNRGGANGQAGLPAGPEQEVVTATWIVPVGASWTLPAGTPQSGMMAQVTQPADGTYNKIYFAGTAGTPSGWSRGLPSMVETYGKTDPAQGGTAVKQRSSVIKWTQDDTTKSFPLNPRVEETNVYDFDSGGQIQNRARTTIGYETVANGDGTSCQLPIDVTEFQANATTPLRRTHTVNNKTVPYLSRRIIGLPSETTLYQVDPNTLVETLMSKVGFAYDSSSIEGTDAPVQHDNTNYTASFLSGRANLGVVTRFDVTNISPATTSTMKYNTAGAVVSTTDALNHTVAISYTDAFAASGTTLDAPRSFTTLAYPTNVTDSDNYTSSTRYNYDFGAPTWKQTPQPNTTQNLPGPEQKLTYDSFGRIQQITNLVNNAYTRYEYPSSQNRVDTYATIQEGLGEAHSFKILDGSGRAIASASDHPGSLGGFSGQLVLYDNLGRAIKTSNPTETSASGTPMQWMATGDDGTAGWLYTQQSYDWKGRPLVTTNTDGTTKQASYGGCGCAGGEVATLTDEGTMDAGVFKRRQQKIYSDVLGRTVKTELLNWQGGSVYSTVTSAYNARDQITSSKQYQGPDSSGVYQETIMTYDGYGRPKTRHAPEHDAGTATIWDYNDDNTVQKVTDARGSIANFTYNNRHLIAGVAYDPSAGVPDTPDVSFGYDSAGNRISMADGLGSVSYNYNQLSRLTSETRTFNGVGSFPLTYDYNLAGELKKVTDPADVTINYGYDQTGRLSNVTGSDNLYSGVSNYASGFEYRAWGALKSMAYGNTTSASLSYNERGLMTRYSLGGVRASISGPVQPEGGEFQYYVDGQIKFANDLRTDATAFGLHDRAYSYDHAGRLKEAYSGFEARDFVNGTNSGVQDGAFRQSYSYDPWGNLTSRTGRFWSEGDTASDSYNNQNRNPAWEYDADGRLISRNEPSPNALAYQPLRFTYDASGRRVQSTQTTSRHSPNPNSNVIFTTVTTSVETYDGNGQPVKKVGTTQTNGGTPSTNVRFYLRSSVLGSLIAEYDSAGVRQNAYVFAAGEVIAQQERFVDGTTRLKWRHTNPLTGDDLVTDSQGVALERATVDPLGVSFGDSDPFTPEGGGGEGGGEGMSQSAIDAKVAQLIPGYGGPQVKLDGFITSPHLAFTALSSGAATFGPSQTVVGIYSRSAGRYVGLATWNQSAARDGVVLFGRGSTGFIPVGTNYQQGWGLSGNNVTQWLANYGPLGQGPHQDFISTKSLQLAAMLAAIPQNPAIPDAIARSDAQVDAKYTECARLLHGSPAPSIEATKSILSTTILEGGSSTLLAVTWNAESGFSFNPNSNPNNGSANNADIGPVQINYGTFHDWAPLAGLGNVFGTTTTGREVFNGNPYDNLRAGARILNSYGEGRTAAGRYRSGTGAFSRTPAGRAAFATRAGRYDQWAGGYDAFFNCLRR